MAIAVQTKYSDVSGKVPVAGDFSVIGQLIVNTYDGVLYVKRPSGDVLRLYENKAPLSSPAFTGNPTAPTATPLTNTTQVATTAFVQGHVTDLSASIEALDARLTLIGG